MNVDDSAEVTRSALQSSTSIATHILFLTTEAVPLTMCCRMGMPDMGGMMVF